MSKRSLSYWLIAVLLALAAALLASRPAAAQEKPGGAVPQAEPDKLDTPAATIFTPTFGIEPVDLAAADWGDYDNDGDLDALVFGRRGLTASSGKIYRNEGSGFTPLDLVPPALSAAARWGDYDDDGDLDFVLSGEMGSGGRRADVFRNDNGSFTATGQTSLTAVLEGAADWGDYDNDGDLDLAMLGRAGASRITRVYRNDDGTFINSGAALTGLGSGGLDWGDYDNDGDLDLVVSGRTDAGAPRTILYRNSDGGFADADAGLAGLTFSSVAWGDYNRDGLLDLALSGLGSGNDRFVGIYQNDRGQRLVPDVILNAAVAHGSLAWGDYDSDGDLDLLVTGSTNSNETGALTKLFRNDFPRGFNDSQANLPGLYLSAAAWGDYDNDGRLDLLLSGSGAQGRNGKIYRNLLAASNTPPGAPQGLSATAGNLILLSWQPATDTQTISRSLSYNLRVGTTPGGTDVVAPMSLVPTGTRLLPAIGNAGHNTAWSLRNLIPGQTYYWSVQAVDTAFAGSPFAAEGTFTILPPSFEQVSTQLPGVFEGSVDWGDYDGDGDLDLFLSGDTGSSLVSRLYLNTSGLFADVTATAFPNGILPGVGFGSVAWGDYDSDGDLDLFLSGFTGGTSRVSRLYQNSNGLFADVTAAAFRSSAPRLPGVMLGSVAWGDYDNDGDLDLFLSGDTGASFVSRLYRNSDGLFGDVTTRAFPNSVLPGVSYGSVAWGDYDNDGDLDLFLSGFTGGTSRVSMLYQNSNGLFADVTSNAFRSSIPPLPGVASGSVAWGDYDSDGDLDLFLSGHTGSSFVSRLYRNSSGDFADVTATTFPNSILPGVASGSVDWGDYDNDGDLDLLLSGLTGDTSLVSRLYHNTNGVFADASATAFPDNILPGVYKAAVEWGDYDDDGRLDLLLGGESSSGAQTLLYHNVVAARNTPPGPPRDLSATVATTSSMVLLSWQPATDTQTISRSLSYNLRVGTTPGGSDVAAPMSLVPTGTRLLPAMGNAGHNTSWTLRNVILGQRYYWSVQAVDTAFAGSPFAAEGTFIPLPSFEQVSTQLPGVFQSAVEWGDYDNDGDLDLFLSGHTGLSQLSRLYRNSSGDFADVTATTFPNSILPALSFSAMDWGDYDNDGDLDLFLSGSTIDRSPVSKLYRNTNGVFADVTGAAFRTLHGVAGGTADWGDYDNDGDLDLFLSGSTSSTSSSLVSRLYRNANGLFADVTTSAFPNSILPGVNVSSVEWVDYDNDGDLDLFLSGSTVGASPVSKLYQYANGLFADVTASAFPNGILPGVYEGAVEWGDYDNDGDLDLFFSGHTVDTSPVSKLYHNTNGLFADVTASAFPNGILPGVGSGSVAWGDYDNDGDLDFFLSGSPVDTSPVSKLYHNTDGLFADVSASAFPNGILLAVPLGSVDWGDYDNDGRLDLLLSAASSSGAQALLYHNVVEVSNTPPRPSQDLSASLGRTGRTAFLRWSPASDAQTISRSLSYNLRVGTTPGGTDVVAPMSLVPTGTRLLPAMGNAGHNISWTLRNLIPGQTYYWSVQAVDTAFAGSPFAREVSFTVPGANLGPNPGTNSPARGAVSAGQRQQFVTTCSDPDGWRDVSTIDFKLLGTGANSGRLLFWAQFDQERSLFRFYDPDNDSWSEGAPGENRVLSSAYAELHLAGTRFQGRGPTNPIVDVTWDLVFKPAAAAAYDQVLRITDDAGLSRGDERVGDWLVLTAGVQTFSDVLPNDYFYNAVEYLFQQGVVSGYGGSFRPYNSTTRGQMAKIIVLAKGLELVDAATPRFHDVPTSDPFFSYVETAAANSIVSGYDDGSFRPYIEVTRGQLSKIVVVAMGWGLAKPAEPSFLDVSREHPFYVFVETAVLHGIVGGYEVAGGREFRPGNNATRGQIARIVYLAIGN